LGIVLARLLPKKLGYWIIRQGARFARRRNLVLFALLRENLARVRPELENEALDSLAEQAVLELGKTYFDMFHHSRKALLGERLLTRDESEWARARAVFESPRGCIVVGAHIGNYDLAAQWFVANGYELQALSLAEPGRGTRVVNRVRKDRGMIVTPISITSLREAVRRLRAGGVIITGVDRPANYDDPPVSFFAEPAPLPRGHIRLALQTDACVMVAYCARQPDGKYRLRIKSPIEMERTGDREMDIERNTRRVLSQIEECIREAPEHWAMLHPIWRKPGEASYHPLSRAR